MDNTNSFTDGRGTIRDLYVTDEYSITHITFKKGAIRGNHYHKETIQKDMVMSGELVCATSDGKTPISTGNIIIHEPNEPHAYQAITDAEILSICFGKRRGEHYEEDTIRLETPLL